MTATASVTVTAMKTTARMIAILPAVREPLFFKNTKSVLNGHSRPDANDETGSYRKCSVTIKIIKRY